MPRIQNSGQKLLRVGLCQVHTEEWAVEENLARTIQALREAADCGADVAVTPECVLQGYPESTVEPYADGQPFQTRKGYLERLRETAEPLQGPHLQRVQEVTEEAGIYVVLGFAEIDAQGRLYNSAGLISPQGRIIDIYRKVHLRPFEDVRSGRGYFSEGDRFFAHDLDRRGDVHRAGIMICFDREIPESVRCLRSLGAKIIFCPLATETCSTAAPGSHVDNELVTRVRAAENEVSIVVVNHAGRFNGGSFVVGPSGEVLHQMGNTDGVSVVDIDLDRIGREFHRNPLGWMGWGYRRPEVYAKYLSKG